jgi:hypothetical protein
MLSHDKGKLSQKTKTRGQRTPIYKKENNKKNTSHLKSPRGKVITTFSFIQSDVVS